MSLITVGKPTNFVVLIRDGQALVQTFGSNAPRLGREMLNRRECPAREHIPADSRQHDDERKPEHEHDQHFPQLFAQPVLGPGTLKTTARPPTNDMPVSVRQR